MDEKKRIFSGIQPSGELTLGGQSHARLQLLFFNQRPDATRHVVGQAFRHHYHGIIQVKT